MVSLSLGDIHYSTHILYTVGGNKNSVNGGGGGGGGNEWEGGLY